MVQVPFIRDTRSTYRPATALPVQG